MESIGIPIVVIIPTENIWSNTRFGNFRSKNTKCKTWHRQSCFRNVFLYYQFNEIMKHDYSNGILKITFRSVIKW